MPTTGTRRDQAQLTSAKDRAQLSSASAMSILDVGVLGEVIKRGSSYSMYVPLLVMISLALFLQITVGVISLRISNMKKFYSRFGSARRRRCGRVRCGGICCHEENSEEDPDPPEIQQVVSDANHFMPLGDLASSLVDSTVSDR